MMERRHIGLGEIKFAGSDADMTFKGYGAVFGNIDSYGDVIQKGAFDKTLKQSNSSGQMPAMLLQHGGSFMGSAEDMTPIGVWTNMHEDEKGLWVEGKLADTQRGRDAYTLLKMTPRPAITGLSIGFRATEWTMRSKPEEPKRTLKAIDLMEVSLVTFPANGKARIESVKSVFDGLAAQDWRDVEAVLRDEGLSRTDAVKAVSGLKAWSRRDAGTPETAPRDEVVAAELRTFAQRIRALAPTC